MLAEAASATDLADAERDPSARGALLASAYSMVEDALARDADGPAVHPGTGDAGHLHVGAAGRPVGEVLADLATALGSGVNTRSPRYLGYLPSGALYAAAVGDFVAAALNPYSAMAAVSPGAAAVESSVVGWMCEVLGLGATASGVLTSGASLATLTAVIAAREALGVRAADVERTAVYVGEHRHHSVDRALRFAGLGEAALRIVPSRQGRMDPAALRRILDHDVRRGLRPVLVVPTAGTTGTGAVDPVADVTAEARRVGAWVHADAAYGGLFRLARTAPAALAGLADVDSAAVDPHKALFMPYGSGALLVRDRSVLASAFAHTADYLEPSAAEADSPADLGLELTRPARALRVWLPLQLTGTAAFAAALDERLALARRAHDELATLPGVAIGAAPDLAVVTFRVRPRPGAAADGDAATAAVADAIRRDGRVVLTTTVVDGRLTLRLAIGSPRTTTHTLDEVLDVVGCTVAAAHGARNPLPENRTHLRTDGAR